MKNIFAIFLIFSSYHFNAQNITETLFENNERKVIISDQQEIKTVYLINDIDTTKLFGETNKKMLNIPDSIRVPMFPRILEISVKGSDEHIGILYKTSGMYSYHLYDRNGELIQFDTFLILYASTKEEARLFSIGFPRLLDYNIIYVRYKDRTKNQVKIYSDDGSIEIFKHEDYLKKSPHRKLINKE